MSYNYNNPPGYYSPYGYYPTYSQPPYPPNSGYPMGAMPMPYGYYPGNVNAHDGGQLTPSTPPVYAPYSQTRMAAPAPTYVHPYPTTPPTPPHYNFNTTNLISRPTRPMLYPQLSQIHAYPPTIGTSVQISGMPGVPVHNTGKPGQIPGTPSQIPGTPSQIPGTPGQTAGTPGQFPGRPSGNVVNNGVSTSKRNSADGDDGKRNSDGGHEKSESNDTVGSLPGVSLNLIDFGRHSGSVRVSVLEAFDPLLTEQSNTDYAAPSETSSVYEEYDPLEFLYGETEMRDAPVYATVSKRDKQIQPAPPPKSIPSVPAAVPNRVTTNKLYDSIVKLNTRNYTSEHKAFVKMVLDVRKKFPHTDESTNPGFMIAQRSAGKYAPNTSIKIVVYPPQSEEPISFTSDVESTVDHVILTVVCSLEEEVEGDESSGYMLRVYGAEEYLLPGCTLSSFAYVRECVRLERDVRLVLRPRATRHDAMRHDARTARDDARATHLTASDILPTDGTSQLSFDNLSILFETLEGEFSRAIGVTSAEGSCPPMTVYQATKAICALVGGIETLHITHTLNAFAQACAANNNSTAVTPEIISDSGPYSTVSLRRATRRESVCAASARVRDAVRSLLALCMRARLVDVALAAGGDPPRDLAKAVPAHTISETTLICIEAVHSVPPEWRHDEYVWHAQVYHGTRPMMRLHTTQCCQIDCGGFYPRIIFDTWINLEDMPVNTLPRESRLVLTLHGRTQRPQDSSNNPDSNPQHVEEGNETMYQQDELGWTALQLFDYDGMLASGNYLLPIWPVCADKRLGPAPDPMHSPSGPHPVVNIEIPLYAHSGVKWTSGETKVKPTSHKEQASFDSLDGHTQSQLLHLIEQGSYQKMPTECREVMWEKRKYLVQLPGALPLVLLTASNWSGEPREQLISLLNQWERPSPHNAIHLLLPCFPDSAVREYASELIGEMSDDDLCSVLPQLVQAVRHETYIVSPLAALLLSRALASPRIAHSLYCLLAHYCTEGANQETLGITLEEGAASNPDPSEKDCCVTWSWRIRLLTRALVLTCGEKIAAALSRQQLLVKALSDVAHSVKTAKDGNRQRALTSSVQELANLVRNEPTSLPLGLAKRVHDVDIKSCTYFSSNTLPLKINFIGMDNAVIPAMFKVGDDLRQDALVLQIMRVMDNLWLKAGLDLRMVTFQALPTSYRKGMIEIVTEAETLRAIQTEWGLTGSFKDKPIAEWLAKHNPSELEYQRARDNFTASCAGYSVATYLLGICDRHNDNIMLKTSGHLFHIDFGKFLGDAQMFGNFKRDRAPFVLTHDMVYVINGGDRPTQRFHHFVELCCMAFNIVRQHSSHILDLIALMATAGVSGVTPAAVGYVRAALLPLASAPEAAAAFARLIHSSLKSKFTPINFFLHNLAQMRASGDQGSSTSELLSFIPRTYTMAQEGRLVSVECLGYEKRYDPEKHYVYALRIYRQGQATPSVLYRSYKHFTELYQKICVHFPLAKVHSLPSGLHVGRSNIRQVAERRFGDVQAFLTSLFSLADEIAHSDLVYTFFHPLLRDQQDIEPQRVKNRGEVTEAENSGSGALKLSIQYSGGVLSVLILHAQSLAITPQGLPPNPYVKVYLVPDPTKETKRKTRVLKRNSHPSFMEMLEYRLPIDVIKNRSLQATVWHYDSLQENQFLGGVVIPLNALSLREETLAWYPLEYIPR